MRLVSFALVLGLGLLPAATTSAQSGPSSGELSVSSAVSNNVVFTYGSFPFAELEVELVNNGAAPVLIGEISGTMSLPNGSSSPVVLRSADQAPSPLSPDLIQVINALILVEQGSGSGRAVINLEVHWEDSSGQARTTATSAGFAVVDQPNAGGGR